MKKPLFLAILLVCLPVLIISCSSNDDAPMQQGTENPDPDPDPDPTDDQAIVCENGFAENYPCNDYNLQSHITLNEFNATGGNDSWGWTDPANGKEYAIMGVNNGTVFVDISDPFNPVYLGKLPTATSNSGWRDIKVYNNHAFIVSEAPGHGMQVFNLSQLNNVTNPPVTFTAAAHYTGFGNAHNIVINEDTGYAYVVGTDTNDAYNGGVHFINIQDPLNPTAEGGFGALGYTHDAQVITYNGPDTSYQGREIFVGANESQVVIVDVTDKSNPQTITTLTYGNVGYTHQGWFTPDHRYFLLGDEFDEISDGFRSRTLVFDFSDLNNPQLHNTYLGPTNAIDHNGYINGNTFYLANYTAGVRMIDVSDINNITEIGFFDTYPQDDLSNFNGVWSVYPFFSSGNIVVSDINSGLFIIKKKD